MRHYLLQSFFDRASEVFDILLSEGTSRGVSEKIIVFCLLVLAIYVSFSSKIFSTLIVLFYSLGIAYLLQTNFRRLFKLAVWVSVLTLVIVLPMSFYRAALQQNSIATIIHTVMNSDFMIMTSNLTLRAVTAAITLSIAICGLGLTRFLKGLRGLGLPRSLVIYLELFIRLIPTTFREASRIVAARESRVVASKGIIHSMWSALVSSTGDLLLRNIIRAHRLRLAIESRGGYDSIYSVALRENSVGSRDVALVIITMVVICISLLVTTL